MEKYKNDLSYNKTTVDYQALLNAAQYAYTGLKMRLEDYKNAMDTAHHEAFTKIHSENTGYLTRDLVNLKLDGEGLAETAVEMAKICDTLATLMGAYTRDEFEVVNTPFQAKQKAQQATSLFWDCECKDNYIHRVTDNVCIRCGAVRDEQPDSRVNEVLAWIETQEDIINQHIVNQHSDNGLTDPNNAFVELKELDALRTAVLQEGSADLAD